MGKIDTMIKKKTVLPVTEIVEIFECNPRISERYLRIVMDYMSICEASFPDFYWVQHVLHVGLDQKKRALKFALKGSESFKACFELYRCLNPEKSFKSSFKNDFWAFLHDFCSTMFWVVS